MTGCDPYIRSRRTAALGTARVAESAIAAVLEHLARYVLRSPVKLSLRPSPSIPSWGSVLIP